MKNGVGFLNVSLEGDKMLISKELNMVFEGCEKYLCSGLLMVCVVSLSVVSELVV